MIIGSYDRFVDVKPWYARLAVLERQVCRVEILAADESIVMSTGFLVGPDVLMTSYHPIEYVKRNYEGIEKVVIRFDYSLSSDGKQVDEGIEYHLATTDWLIDYATPEKTTLNYLPDSSELDYALLKIEGNPGLRISDEDNSPRGWIDLLSAPDDIETNAPLSILQYPQGRPLQISFHTKAVIGFNENKSRLLYRTATLPGSSGAPCFDIDWRIIGFHQGNNVERRINQGVPISQVLSLLREHDVLDFVSRKSPHQLPEVWVVPKTVAAEGKFPLDPQRKALIAGGESQRTEFKEAVCRNPYTGKADTRIRKKIVRAVASFMNSEEGGTLFIGVSDSGVIKGIEDEYVVADKSRRDWDGYELFLNNVLTHSLSIETPFQYYRILRYSIDKKDICCIDVEPADKPVYVDKKLYVRVGNQSREVQGPDLVEYVSKRWG